MDLLPRGTSHLVRRQQGSVVGDQCQRDLRPSLPNTFLHAIDEIHISIRDGNFGSGGAPIEIDYRRVMLDHLEVALLGVSGTMTVAAHLNRSYPYLPQFPICGSFDFEIDGRAFGVGPSTGIALSPPCKARRRAQRGWTLALGIDRALVRTRLQLTLGMPPKGPLAFQPLLTTAAEEIRNYCLHLVEAIDRGIAKRGRALTRVLEAGLVDLLLELQPHTHSNKIVRAESSSALARIEAVEQYLQANWAEPLKLDDLARPAGCSVRTLQASFVEYCGMSPVEFIRRCRMLYARECLQAGDRKTTTERVAHAIGYSNPGRFAAHSRQRFGESPAQTLRRATGKQNAANE